jgi:hypothetical protein
MLEKEGPNAGSDPQVQGEQGWGRASYNLLTTGAGRNLTRSCQLLFDDLSQ